MGANFALVGWLVERARRPITKGSKMSFPTWQQAAIDDAADFVTAGGSNSLDESLMYWNLGAEDNANEARANGWEPVGDWSDCWDNVKIRIEKLYSNR
jgi:chitodextrinase